MNALPANKALDMFFLEARSRVLDVAAILDRLGRGTGTVSADTRMAQLQQAIQSLLDLNSGRAERVQQIFSLPYDPTWPRPEPK